MERILAGLLLVWVVSATTAPTTLDITVPESVKVQGEDSYICITKQLPDKPLKLVGVEPLARQEVVHHILLFGECPGQLSIPTPCRCRQAL
jgi:peptidylamidoglycolate lyase